MLCKRLTIIILLTIASLTHPTDASQSSAAPEICTDDTWSPLPLPSSAPSRFAAPRVAVWTGSEVIFWPLGPQGFRYKPSTGTWTAMSALGQPYPFLNYVTAFWTGNEMLVVGQTFTTEALTVGARYNPATDVWTPINSAGPKYSAQVAPVWTGSELLLFADIQSNESGMVTGGGRYNPANDTWTPISIAGAPQRSREINTYDQQLSVWTGTEMLVLNAEYGQDPWYTSSGAYDPATDTWRPVRVSGAPKPECVGIRS
jgi:hypothetical protein